MPSVKDYHIYKSFIVYVVLGKLDIAEALLGKKIHRNSVNRVAEDLQHKLPPPIQTLYRGLLLEPPVGSQISSQYDNYSFISFSEDLDVACWFADPTSWFADEIMAKHPRAAGWIANYTPISLGEILFHWSWRDYLDTTPPVLAEVARDLALANQEDAFTWVHDLSWNLKTQKEVLLKPGPILNLSDANSCSSSDVLDRKFRPRPEYVVAPSGLEKVGILPKQKLYIIDIEIIKPPRQCPSCGNLSMEITYILNQANLTLTYCNLCQFNFYGTVK